LIYKGFFFYVHGAERNMAAKAAPPPARRVESKALYSITLHGAEYGR
jgi:hypothetical protein